MNAVENLDLSRTAARRLGGSMRQGGAHAAARPDERLRRQRPDVLLRNRGVRDCAAGVWTTMPVGHTVRDADDHGYRPVFAV